MKIKNNVIYNSERPLDIISRYVFKGVALYKFAKIKSIVREHKALLDLTKNDLIGRYGIAGEVKQDMPNFHIFIKEWTSVLNHTVELEIPKIKLTELNLEENELPKEELSYIVWLIEEDIDLS